MIKVFLIQETYLKNLKMHRYLQETNPRQSRLSVCQVIIVIHRANYLVPHLANSLIRLPIPKVEKLCGSIMEVTIQYLQEQR